MPLAWAIAFGAPTLATAQPTRSTSEGAPTSEVTDAPTRGPMGDASEATAGDDEEEEAFRATWGRFFRAPAQRDEETVEPTEVRELPSSPCERLTLEFAVSELDRQHARAACLASVRLDDRENRIDEGVILLGFGAMSLLAGSVVAGVATGGGDDLWTSFGLGTAGWGAVNAALSIALFDVAGSGRAAIEADALLTSESLLRARERAVSAQEATSTLLALNAGLDVFYVVGGILMFALGERSEPDDRWLMGYGAAMAAQGAVLLAYDAVTWAFAASRADRLRRLPLD